MILDDGESLPTKAKSRSVLLSTPTFKLQLLPKARISSRFYSLNRSPSTTG